VKKISRFAGEFFDENRQCQLVFGQAGHSSTFSFASHWFKRFKIRRFFEQLEEFSQRWCRVSVFTICELSESILGFKPNCNNHLIQVNAFVLPEPVFVDHMRSPVIDSQPGGPVRQPYFSYRPAEPHLP
jgi:hypothetical protein